MIDQNSGGMKNLRFLLSYIYPYRWVFLVGLISLAITALAIMVIPKILSELINEINFNRDSFLEKRNRLIIAAAVVLIIQAVFSYLRIHTFTYVMEKGMANLRSDLLHKILESRIAFFDTNRVGALMSRVTSDVSTVQDAFSVNLAEFLRQIDLPRWPRLQLPYPYPLPSPFLPALQIQRWLPEPGSHAWTTWTSPQPHP